MLEIPTIEEMLKAGLHFGHSIGKRHPKMESFIFTQRSNVHIIDLEKTTKALEKALQFVTSTVRDGGKVLFLSTKKQAQSIIKKYAESCKMPYVVERWFGGTLTNFSVIHQVIKKYINLKQRREKGEFQKYTKKERLKFEKEIERLEKLVGGLETMEKVPDAIFIVDVKKEKTAVREAVRKKIPIVAICDTNTNPEEITYPIPANDDATKGIKMITSLVAKAVNEGKQSELDKNE